MMRYCNIFRKTDDDYDRYWLSVSTAKLDKKGKPTEDYVRSSIGVRLSNDMKDYFDRHCSKTKSKNVQQGCFKLNGCSFKAVEPKEGEPFTVLFIWDMVTEETDD